MENDGKKWTDNDIKIINEFYSIKGSVYCSDILKRNKKAIIAKAKRLGLKANRNGLKYTKDNILKIVIDSKSLREVLDKLNLRAAGGNYQIIKKYIILYDIDINHFDKQKDIINKNRPKQKPLIEYLTINSNYSRKSLKNRLYKEGLKKRECELCGQGEEWKGKKMSLILDHKNGIYNDNRLENLRIVCPNCNATLETHCSKNKNNIVR